MTEKLTNDKLYEIDGETYSLHEIKGFIESIEELCKSNFILKQRCRDLTRENESLKLEIKDMKFTRNYLPSEEAGRKFAESLLGGA